MTTKIDFANEIQKDINKVIGKLNKLKSYGMRQADKKRLEISKNYLQKAYAKLTEFEMNLPLTYRY